MRYAINITEKAHRQVIVEAESIGKAKAIALGLVTAEGVENGKGEPGMTSITGFRINEKEQA